MQLVDTNVVAELMRPRPDRGVLRWAATQSRLALSVVTVEEVCFGLYGKRCERMERWFESFVGELCEVLPITAGIARRSAALRAEAKTKGRPRTQADMLIAGTASEHELVLVTRNVRDFDGCGVRVRNPFV